VLAALCAAGSVGAFSYHKIRPPRAIARQISPYTAVARAHLGVEVESMPEPLFSGEILRRVLGPPGQVLAVQVAKFLALSDGQGLEQRLRQAGQPMSVEAYRRRHLQYAVGAPVAAGLVGWMLGSTVMVVLFIAAGAFSGARRMPEHLRNLTRRRAERMRSDLPTVAWMLTPKIRNRMTVTVAVADIVRQGSGPVVDDLARALYLKDSAGYNDTAAFELIAKETIEPAAARFYNLLAAATTGGVDLAPALLELARELRTQRREEVARSSAKRQIAMVLPDLAFMAPVLILFLMAPVPRLLFGGH
jgi:tight adherence protein C